MAKKNGYKRREQLTKPGLQLKLCMIFLTVGIVCVLAQFTLWAGSLSYVTSKDAQLGDFLVSRLWSQLGIALAITVPLMLSVGIIVTHRIAGPIYRFERYLEEVAEGHDPGPCRLRKGDELTELCDLINRVTDRLRTLEGQSGAAPAAATSMEPMDESAEGSGSEVGSESDVIS